MQNIQQQFNNVARSAAQSARGVWIKYAESLGIPWNNFLRAYQIDHDILRSFNGKGRWLKGDGNVYLDTGIAANDSWNTIQVIAEMRITKAQTSGESGYFGGKGASSNQAPTIYSSANSLAINSWCGSGTTVAIHKATLNTKFKLDLTYDAVNSKRIYAIDDADPTTVSVSNTGRTAGGTLAIFADGSTPASKAYMDVQSWQIIKNGTEQHYYIPIKQGDTCTMIDLMDNTLTPLPVQGTGKFTIEQ